MKKRLLLTIFLVFAFGSLLGFCTKLHSSQDEDVSEAPFVVLKIIDSSPKECIGNHPEIVSEKESLIKKEYDSKKNFKWIRKYRYVYFLAQKLDIKQRNEYQSLHPDDATEKNVIFSDRMPDENDFRTVIVLMPK